MNKWILALVIGVLAMTTLGQARVSGDADLAVQYASTGWVEDAETRTWSYSSADAPTYVFSVDDDMTGILSAGMRVRFKQSAGTYKYAIITAVGSYSGGVTLITAYFGTDYDLDNEEVTNVAYSAAKSPFGFPMNPDKWTVEVVETTDTKTSTPVVSTWYNADSIELPIGVWNVSYRAYISVETSGTQNDVNMLSTLSTANNTESNTHLTSINTLGVSGAAAPSTLLGITTRENDVISVTSKTTLYLNYQTGVTVDAVGFYAASVSLPTIIRAVCAYL
jgi:hypothetical protein